jgi:hypothetical protein
VGPLKTGERYLERYLQGPVYSKYMCVYIVNICVCI